jgi:hypothetical protein
MPARSAQVAAPGIVTSERGYQPSMTSRSTCHGPSAAAALRRGGA